VISANFFYTFAAKRRCCSRSSENNRSGKGILDSVFALRQTFAQQLCNSAWVQACFQFLRQLRKPQFNPRGVLLHPLLNCAALSRRCFQNVPQQFPLRGYCCGRFSREEHRDTHWFKYPEHLIVGVERTRVRDDSVVSLTFGARPVESSDASRVASQIEVSETLHRQDSMSPRVWISSLCRM